MRAEELGKRMLHYFRTAGCEGSEYKEDLPSFVRFANSAGLTGAALRAICKEDEAFARVYAECEEILADRITDGALHRRLDGSFAKFLLLSRFGFDEAREESEPFAVEILLKEPDNDERKGGDV